MRTSRACNAVVNEVWGQKIVAQSTICCFKYRAGVLEGLFDAPDHICHVLQYVRVVEVRISECNHIGFATSALEMEGMATSFKQEGEQFVRYVRKASSLRTLRIKIVNSGDKRKLKLSEKLYCKQYEEQLEILMKSFSLLPNVDIELKLFDRLDTCWRIGAS